MISIIVPVFGADPYLDECVLSLLRQTYEDIEIILVDDGSLDASGKICDQYAALDHRVRVIHKKNGGLSDARNVGLLHAKGDYIGYVDSDDYISCDMFAHLKGLLDTHQADIAVCGHVKTLPRGRAFPHIPSKKIFVMDSEEALKKMLQIGYYESFAWNKLFRRELLDGILFPFGHLYEDLYTTYKVIHKAKKIVYSKEIKYYYRQRAGSIIHSTFNAKYFDYIQASIELCEFTKKHYPRIYGTAVFAYYRSRMFTYIKFLFSRPRMLFSKEIRREEMYKYIRAIISSIR